jgi:hypothetical protein
VEEVLELDIVAWTVVRGSDQIVRSDRSSPDEELTSASPYPPLCDTRDGDLHGSPRVSAVGCPSARECHLTPAVVAGEGWRMRRLVVLVLGVLLVSGCATSHRAPTTQVEKQALVLGSTRFYGPPGNAVGWGTVHPTRIFNGGDPTGLAWHLAWKHWGSPTAIGYGLTWILAGYNVKGKRRSGCCYTRPAKIELRATDVGRCTRFGPVAYRKLYARVPSHPGGRLGPWGSWSFTGTICRS